MSKSGKIAAAAALCALAGGASAASDGDPSVTDGDKYKVVLDNVHVRVLRYHDLPGEKTHPHRHPPFVMVALSSFRRKLTFPDGTTKVREFKAGEAAYMPAQSHAGENIGDTPTDGLLIELKSSRSVSATDGLLSLSQSRGWRRRESNSGPQGIQ